MTHVSTSNFQGFLKNVVVSSVALVRKKLWAILDFFFKTDRVFPPCTLCINKKKIYKKSFKIFLITVILSKMRVLGQKEGEGQTTPPRIFRVKGIKPQST